MQIRANAANLCATYSKIEVLKSLSYKKNKFNKDFLLLSVPQMRSLEN